MTNQNPILNALQGQQKLLNPQQILQNNPQMAYVMKYVQEHGGDPKTAFYEMAKEKGIDPNYIINSLQNYK